MSSWTQNIFKSAIYVHVYLLQKRRKLHFFIFIVFITTIYLSLNNSYVYLTLHKKIALFTATHPHGHVTQLATRVCLFT